MSVITPNETAKGWKANTGEPSVAVFLTEYGNESADLIGARAAGFPLALNVAEPSDWINPDDVAGAAAVVVQVDASNPASVKRFEELAHALSAPLIAAAYDPPLAQVRSLIRAGAHDVIPLPLNVEELETSLAPVRDEMLTRGHDIPASTGKLVSVMKSRGGIGASGLLSQFAIRYASQESRFGRSTCLIDLDVQFGDIAFQLGLHPKLSLLDLLESGSRLDSALLRSTVKSHPSGLDVIAAPSEILPLEGVPSDHILKIIELAAREYSTVFVDLPTNWTNWSLSLIARSDMVLLVTELTVAGLNRARRQLSLLESQDLGALEIRVLANRFEKSQARTIRASDVRDALGRDIAFTIANDYALMHAAIDQGIPIDDVKRKSALGRDLDLLDAGIAAALGRER